VRRLHASKMPSGRAYALGAGADRREHLRVQARFDLRGFGNSMVAPRWERPSRIEAIMKWPMPHFSGRGFVF
jgi:hypothetical protein